VVIDESAPPGSPAPGEDGVEGSGRCRARGEPVLRDARSARTPR
jgi:hypothetical protein